MTFSRECEYGLKGLAALAADGGARPRTLSEIARRENLPPSFLSKIFQKLAQHGLIQSHRGAQRGYALARPASEITLRETLEAIQGPDLFERCLFSHHRCGEEGPCIVHLVWRGVEAQVREVFERTTLQDLIDARIVAEAAERSGRRGRSRRASWASGRQASGGGAAKGDGLGAAPFS